MSLVVGHIDYLNCVPFFHFLRSSGFSGKIIKGVPAELNHLLSTAHIDVCPSSSFEYGLHWRDYLILPDLSISAHGQVGSVLLISQQPLEALANQQIALTGESATSVNLLRILLQEYYGLTKIIDYVPTEPVEKIVAEGKPALLIGDRALRIAQTVDPSFVYDLGELWQQNTGNAFVFALWMVREEIAELSPGLVSGLMTALNQSLSLAWESLPELGQTYTRQHWMQASQLCEYWQMMDYGLGPRHLEGLELYFRLCCKYDLLKSPPEIRFFEANNR